MTAGVANLKLRKPVSTIECALPGDWADRAVCAQDLNPLWISTPTAETRPHQIELADEICGRCPVRRECRSWARSGPQFEGVAGGLLWPWGAICQGTGHGVKGDKDKWCGTCQTRD